jgi:hypothetical protein
MRWLTGTATITGVGFFNKSHRQGGGANNGIELHPVLGFASTSCRTGSGEEQLTSDGHPRAIFRRAIRSTAGTSSSRRSPPARWDG